MNELINALIKLQSEVFKMYSQAHGYHWNIEGRMFKQDHAFLLEIYEDVYDSIDPISENLRKLGAKAPFGPLQWLKNSALQINDSLSLKSDDMLQELYNTNNLVINSLTDAFDKADAIDSQGICNFLADRIDKHQFWAWQLKSSLKLSVE